ncbi:MAG: VIT1/CCC1 transporter family protein [Acidimicrobiales bacterium]
MKSVTSERESASPEPHHRDVSGGRLRPAVFGAMDGLVTNVSLIAGVGGGGAVRHTVILSGLAGLVAGSFSMATGEFTSVKSQNESVDAEVEVERDALTKHPREEQRELATSFVRMGVTQDLADEVAEQISKKPEEALKVHASQELGVNPAELPSPFQAAALSFISFAIGAAIPLLPFLFGATALWLSLAVTAFALAITGGTVARLTSRPIALGAIRQVGLAVLAAGVTYAVGRGIGAGVA